MTTVTIYSKAGCSYCLKAKELAEQNGLQVTEVNALALSNEDWIKAIGHRPSSVPQIVFNGKYIGGYRELYNLIL